MINASEIFTFNPSCADVGRSSVATSRIFTVLLSYVHCVAHRGVRVQSPASLCKPACSQSKYEENPGLSLRTSSTGHSSSKYLQELLNSNFLEIWSDYSDLESLAQLGRCGERGTRRGHCHQAGHFMSKRDQHDKARVVLVYHCTRRERH